jgi:hypothetical protein
MFRKVILHATGEDASEYKRAKGRDERMEVAIVMVAVIGYLAFRQWLQLDRRRMIHRERLAAIEKGVDFPPLEQEARRSSWNVQRFLLLAGLVWLSLGIGTFVTLSALLAHPTPVTQGIPLGMQWIGLAPVCIGLSHLIVYLIGKKREN